MPTVEAEIVDSSSELSEDDKVILDSMDVFLSDGLAMKRWWEEAEVSDGLADRFELAHTVNRPESSFGFFGKTELRRGTIPVMGCVDQMLYDRPKSSSEVSKASAEWMRDQIREFVLGYFMRVSDFRMQERVIDEEQRPLPPFLRLFSMRPKADIQRRGMGFSQVFYRRKGSEEPEKFAEGEQSAITDLREIGTTYDWIMVKLHVNDFCVTMKPFGPESPRFVMPLKEQTYLVLTPEFITNVDNPEPGVLGEYGFGYAFVQNPTRGPFAYGPGEFEAAFQTINFKVMEDGEVRLKMTFVSDQPDKIMNLKFDPVTWSFSLADLMSFGLTSRIFGSMKRMMENLPLKGGNVDPTIPTLDLLNFVTAGQAGERLDMRKERLFKGFLTQHSAQHTQTLLGSLRTWRQVPDWLDKDSLPEWVVSGQSS